MGYIRNGKIVRRSGARIETKESFGCTAATVDLRMF